MYWPAFEFKYRLDFRRVVPHLAAMECYRQAATARVLPPQWRDPPLAATSASPETSPETMPPGSAALARAWVADRFAPGSAPVSLSDLLTMHRMVADPNNPESLPGTFRILPVQVGRKEVGGIHFGAPPESVPRLMNEYVAFINGKDCAGLHPVIQALVAHFFLVTVHPFGDANGRVSRLLMTGLLSQRGYNVHGGFYALSAYFYQNDVEYHTLLHRCWQVPPPFDLTAFAAFGMEGFVMELRSINSFIRAKLDRITDRDALAAVRSQRRSRYSALADC
jgi:Fic family protein